MAHAIDEDDDLSGDGADPVDGADGDGTGSSADDDAAARGRRPYANRRAVVQAVALVAANAAALTFVGSRYAYQLAGERNANFPFLVAWPDVVVGAVWLATLALLVRAAWAGAGVARHLAIGGLAACAAALPTGCLTAHPSADRYAAGLATWAAAKVDADALRSWQTTLPTVSARTAVPADRWPPAVAALNPGAVEQLPAGQGVILQWGTTGSWGNSRKVWVGALPSAAGPLPEEQHLWRMAKEGVYVAQQVPGS